MAAGKINLQKASGGITSITGVDGAGNTSLILPESGTVATTAAATTSLAGLVELATNAETITGTDTARAITPANLMSAFNKTGSAPMYACRAWVNFNGTGTVAIRASGNVSSITDQGAGSYVVNFATAMPDANYAKNVHNSGNVGVNTIINIGRADTITSTAVDIINIGNNAGVDTTLIDVSIFR